MENCVNLVHQSPHFLCKSSWLDTHEFGIDREDPSCIIHLSNESRGMGIKFFITRSHSFITSHRILFRCFSLHDIWMGKGYSSIFDSWFTHDDISPILLDLACEKAGIEDGDISGGSSLVLEADIIDSPSSSHKDRFLDNFSFGSGNSFLIEDELF